MIQAKFTRTDNLKGAVGMIAEEMRRAAAEANARLLPAVQGRSPVDQGTFKGSLRAKLEQPSPLVVNFGIVSTDSPVKVEAIESGRKPGSFPNVNAMRALVRRKTGLTDPRKVNALAYVWGKTIKERGIKARKVFETTYKENAAFLEQLFTKQLPERIIKRIL
jgi:hypothetical protein